MTVLQLKEMLEVVPNNAVVIVAHELVGPQHYAEDVEYLRSDYYSDLYDGVLIIHELPEGDRSEPFREKSNPLDGNDSKQIRGLHDNGKREIQVLSGDGSGST